MSQSMYPDRSTCMMQKYKEAISKPYGCLVIDLKSAPPEQERMRTNIMTDKDNTSFMQDVHALRQHLKPRISSPMDAYAKVEPNMLSGISLL